MQYQVPQFIEIEDKIFGPLTFKQFAYVAGGGAICFLAYRFFPIYISFFIILPVGGFSLALAFYKVNNRPFVFIVESAVKFFLSKKLYLWQKTKYDSTAQRVAAPVRKDLIPKLSESKLRELEKQPNKDGWYNVNDILPHYNGIFLITLKTSKGKRVTFSNYISKIGFCPIPMSTVLFLQGDVIAWKELDKPYEG